MTLHAVATTVASCDGGQLTPCPELLTITSPGVILDTLDAAGWTMAPDDERVALRHFCPAHSR